MRTVQRIETKGNATRLVAVEVGGESGGITARMALIQALIPLGLAAVAEALQEEVETLAGQPHARQGRQPGVVRWGEQRGSVYLADQKLPVVVPRVRGALDEGCWVGWRVGCAEAAPGSDTSTGGPRTSQSRVWSD